MEFKDVLRKDRKELTNIPLACSKVHSNGRHLVARNEIAIASSSLV